MPNYCENILKIYGEKESLKKILKEITYIDEEKERRLDFNKIIPQPHFIFNFSVNDSIINAINNYIHKNNIKDEKEIKNIIEDKAWDDAFEQRNEKFSFIDMTKREFVKKYYDQTAEVKPVVASWYMWNNKNWGTKWNALEPNHVSIQDNELYFNFNTAWAPAKPVIAELIYKYENNEDYKDIEIEYFYYEPGMGFIGDRYEEYDSEDINTYATKILEYGFEETIEYCGITWDKNLKKYRAMTDEEDDYFCENDTLEGLY